VIVPADATAQTQALLAGAGCRPIGSIAYEAYRISRGLPSRPGEISELYNPYDISLTDDVSYTKGCYIGQEVIARLDTYQKSKRRLAGLLFEGLAPGREGQRLLKGERDIGVLTSALNVPVGGFYFGLGVITDADALPGQVLVAGDSRAQGKVAPFPISAAA
jgi:folate-binding protein YgfZ